MHLPPKNQRDLQHTPLEIIYLFKQSESSKINNQMTGSIKFRFQRKLSNYSNMLGSESVDKANKILLSAQLLLLKILLMCLFLCTQVIKLNTFQKCLPKKYQIYWSPTNKKRQLEKCSYWCIKCSYCCTVQKAAPYPRTQLPQHVIRKPRQK